MTRAAALRAGVIVDPLDGTREFSELGATTGRCTCALAGRRAGRRPVRCRHRSYVGDASGRRTSRAPAKPRIVVSRPGLRYRAGRSRCAGRHTGRNGSAEPRCLDRPGLSDVYVHAGGQFEWTRQPRAVARAAGLHTSRIDGSALVYNQPDRSCQTWSSAVRTRRGCACRDELNYLFRFRGRRLRPFTSSAHSFSIRPIRARAA